MAVSGAGGWIPSCGVYLYHAGGLCEIRTLPLTQNKPKSCVELNLDAARRRILAGEIVQIDMRAGNYVTLKRLIQEATRDSA